MGGKQSDEYNITVTLQYTLVTPVTLAGIALVLMLNHMIGCTNICMCDQICKKGPYPTFRNART